MKPNILCYNINELRGGIPQLLALAQPEPNLPLDYGWLVEEQMVLVEHKSVNDLAQSLRSGHLREQLEKAKAQTPFVYLLVTGLPVPGIAGDMGLRELTDYGHGTWGDEVSGQWEYDRFMDALLSLLHGLQVGGPVVGLTKDATARNLLALYRQTRRETLGRGRPVLPRWQTTKKYDQVEAYARAFPGVGFRRAEALTAWAPTWERLVIKLNMRSGAKGLASQVEGFGPVLAERVYKMVMEGQYAN